jgi:RNA polymerase sigma-70 factor (ECF subfamily)
MTSDQHDHSHCLSMFEKLSEYIDNELDVLTCWDIERHVEACVPCKICLETLKRTVKLCKKVDSIPVPDSVSLKLRELIQSMSSGRSTLCK